MLSASRYLLGVVELSALIGSAALGAAAVRSRLLPRWSGAPAWLATAVLGLALLIWVAELLGTVGLFKPLPYVIGVALAALAAGVLSSAESRDRPYALLRAMGRSAARPETTPSAASGRGHTTADATPRTAASRSATAVTVVALLIAAAAVIHFAVGVRTRLGTGMTGFDSTWYHGPFAAGFFQGGSTWDLHFIAPQFLAWFYPANGEIFHAIGMLAFGRDVLSPLLNLGWFAGCLLAGWCIGRPYRVAPISLALAAVALSVPALSDQAGEARNDIVDIFFLLAAVAIALNAVDPIRPPTDGQRERSFPRIPGETAFALPALAISGLAAGLAAGTKLNFLLPAAVLVFGFALIAPRRIRWRAFAVTGLAAVAGGGYWYLRNLAHAGNPLPWVHHLGPITLPAPGQGLGGREGHGVLGYLTDGSVWSDWLLPGLHEGLWVVWPLLLAAALVGLLLSLAPRATPLLRVAGAVGLATALAWLIAPTSASGPDGMPRGFESGLRYLAPVLVLGLALVPVVLSGRLREAGAGGLPNGRILKAPSQLARRLSGLGAPRAGLVIALVLLVAVGYPIQRHYLENRYADPSFTTPGLNAAFGWSRDISDARIATTSTRQYPLFGTDLSNRVDYVGVERPHGGFTAPSTCPAWRRLLDAGDYDYVVTSRDRLEPAKPPYPVTAHWTEGPGAKVVLRQPPTVVFELTGPLSPSACR
jgi:hypothetical protein